MTKGSVSHNISIQYHERAPRTLCRVKSTKLWQGRTPSLTLSNKEPVGPVLELIVNSKSSKAFCETWIRILCSVLNASKWESSNPTVLARLEYSIRIACNCTQTCYIRYCLDYPHTQKICMYVILRTLHIFQRNLTKSFGLPRSWNEVDEIVSLSRKYSIEVIYEPFTS